MAPLTERQIARYERLLAKERAARPPRPVLRAKGVRPPRGKRGVAPTPAMLVEMAYRANDPCAYCGNPSEHWDHMEARYRGGWNEPDNLIRACRKCNVSKRTRSPLVYFALRAAGLRS